MFGHRGGKFTHPKVICGSLFSSLKSSSALSLLPSPRTPPSSRSPSPSHSPRTVHALSVLIACPPSTSLHIHLAPHPLSPLISQPPQPSPCARQLCSRSPHPQPDKPQPHPKLHRQCHWQPHPVECRQVHLCPYLHPRVPPQRPAHCSLHTIPQLAQPHHRKPRHNHHRKGRGRRMRINGRH